MVVKTSRIYIPKRGKNQINLERFSYKRPDYSKKLFTIFLPCSKTKPYQESSTHSYIHLKIEQNIPEVWQDLIDFCTISEVIGIIPEKLEEKLFDDFREEFFYEHYPSYEEGDIERTSRWLKNFICKYGTKYNYCYCTSKIFRDISLQSKLECFPKNFKKSSALFEFRKTANVKELTDAINETYKNTLTSRYLKWKKLNSHSYHVLKFAAQNNPFDFKSFKNEFANLKNPRANVNTFCNESISDKGIFFYYNENDKKYYFPKFLINILNIKDKSD